MRAAAEKECDVLLAEAELRAEKIIDASHRRAGRLAENIRELRGLRAQIAESLRAVLDTHIGLIENLTIDTASTPLVDAMVDGKIAYLDKAKIARETLDEDPVATSTAESITGK
jgi:cell division initiation protein